MLSGCQGILEHSQRELTDHAKSQQVFRNTLQVRIDQLGVSVGYYGEAGITGENSEMIAEYLEIAEENDPNTMKNYKLAYSYGLGLRLYRNMIERCWLDIQGYMR